MARLPVALVRGIHHWSGSRLGEPTVEVSDAHDHAAEPDYHALDRLYVLQSEERQERRGLETRAVATLAAAVTSVAFSANAVSSRISGARPLAVVFLSIGVGLLGVGVLTTSVVLFGRSRLASGLLRLAAAVVKSVGVTSTVATTYGRSRQGLEAALAARRQALKDGNAGEVQEANRGLRLAIGRLLASTVSVGIPLAGAAGLPLDLALSVLASRSDRPAARPGDGDAAEPAEFVRQVVSLREPGDLETALDVADRDAQRLQGENVAMVVVLRWTSLMVGLGVIFLVAGIIALLIEVPTPLTT